ncbi:MAG: trigger factor [Bacteroidota bacterium]
MPNYDFQQHSPVSASLTITLPEAELNTALKEELKKARQRVDMKGFRKGKTPISVLRKMMGNQMLGDIIDQKIQESMSSYLEENEVDLIFSPMAKEQQEEINLDARQLADVTIAFDLALRPDFEISFPAEPLTKYALEVDDSLVDESLDRLRKQLGTQEEIKKDIQAEDILTVDAIELNDKGNKKRGGITNEFKLFLSNASESVKEQLLGQDKGAEIKVNIHEIEDNATESYVRKYFLGLEDEEASFGDDFKLVVKTVERLKPAELDEDFFGKYDPSGAVTDEAGLRERIAEDNRAGFADQGRVLLQNELTRYMVENTEIELPADFMERVRKEENSKPERFERGVRWMLIRNKYAGDHDIQLQQEDLRRESDANILQMMGGQRPEWLNDDFLNNFLQRTMEDEKQRDELVFRALENKIVNHLLDNIDFKEEEVSADRFNEIIKEFNEQYGEEEE